MEYRRYLLLLVAFCGRIYSEECDVLIDQEEYASIITPNYPEDYPSGVRCRYLIRAPPLHLVMLSFNSFMIEMGPGCSYDSLKVYDGGSTSSDLLNTFCGYETPPYIISSSSELTLIFETDTKDTDEGFNASINFFSASEMQKSEDLYPRSMDHADEVDPFDEEHQERPPQISAVRRPAIIRPSTRKQLYMNACGDRWLTFRNSSYCFMERVMMWHDAGSACSEIGGHLVTINSRSENNFIKRSTRHVSGITSWIGYNDLEREGRWTWADTKEDVSFTNWQDTEPNNLNNEDCAIIYLKRKAGKVYGGWHDNPCCSEFTSICEKSA